MTLQLLGVLNNLLDVTSSIIVIITPNMREDHTRNGSKNIDLVIISQLPNAELVAIPCIWQEFTLWNPNSLDQNPATGPKDFNKEKMTLNQIFKITSPIGD